MIIWNIKKLKQNIVEGKVTDRQYLLYFLPLVCTVPLVFCTLTSDPISPLEAIWLCMLSAFTAITCFRLGKQHKMSYFTEKYLAICFVTSTRFTIFSFIIFFLLTFIIILSGILPDMMDTNSTTFKNYIWYLASLVGICSCLYTYYHFRDLCHRFKNHATQPENSVS